MDTNIENLWQQFSKPLRRFIQRRVANEQDVDDILQDVFYKIYSHLNRLEDTEKIHAWVYRITRNAIIDFYRAQKYEKGLIELRDDMACESDDVSTANDEIAQCLIAMINDLPEKDQQAILLTEFQHLTQRELGEKMNLSVSGAKSRVQRARAKLKKMLIGCCQLEFDRLGNVIDYAHKHQDCKFCEKEGR